MSASGSDMTRILTLWFGALAVVLTPLALTYNALADASAGGIVPGTAGQSIQIPDSANAPPIISSCGSGSPFIGGSGNSVYMRFAMLGAGTTCTLTWSAPRTYPPVCSIMSETAGTSVLIVNVNTSAALTWSWTGSVQATWDVVCWGS
jgi:hypothetical protein